MFRVCLIASVLTGFSQELAATPCVMGTLDTYLGTSCTAHGIDFSGWSYSADGTAVAASAITVIPSVANANFEFTVFGGGWAAGVGVTRTPSIFFSGTGLSVGSRLFLGSSTTSGTGTVLATLDACVGDLFAGGCTGPTPSLSNGPPFGPVTNSFGGSFTPVDLQLIMRISGGTDGEALINSVQAGLFSVPEPRTVSLVAVALALAALRKRFF